MTLQLRASQGERGLSLAAGTVEAPFRFVEVSVSSDDPDIQEKLRNRVDNAKVTWASLPAFLRSLLDEPGVHVTWQRHGQDLEPVDPAAIDLEAHARPYLGGALPRSTTLLLTEDGEQLFLVPEPERLPEGSLVLRSVQGASFAVDPEVVARFAADRDAVEAHIQGSVVAGVRDFTERVRSWAASLERAPDRKRTDPRVDAARRLEQAADWLSGGLRDLAGRLREGVEE